MNKKEVAEIRRQYVPERCTISRICGCYVDAEKNIKTTMKEAFLSLPEDDAFKYFTIFKKTLSGTVGRNLVNLDFPLEEEHEGGHQEFLLKLRNSKLKDDALVEEFYNRIIDTFPFGENYYIILIHVAYDVPGKATDGTEMYDASDNVFEYLLCSLCPVHLSKPGLGYNEAKNCIENRIQDWIVDQPMKGFLFPAFNDRYTDIHSMLYYTKNATDLQEDFLKNMFGCTRIPLDADSQKETFNCLIADTLGTDCDYSVVKNIHEILNEKIEEFKDSPEPLELGKQDVRRLFEDSGVPDSRMEDFDQCYDEEVGEQTTFLATNIASSRKFNIETPDVVVKVNPEAADLVETRIIDGRQCLVIAINEHVEVNGISIAVAPEGVAGTETEK
ncbi:DUF4317 domain-containing protein [Lachnospiraceae bacterium AM48-27BH]|nr:DUF4317 domain-containing protein [Lachnospiraceae bacterium AM48-27BH]